MSQFGSLAALVTQQNKVDALVDLGVGVAERQAYTSTAANTLMKKLSDDAGAFNSISTKTIAAIDRNVNDTTKQYARAAALVPILTEIKEESAIEKLKKLAQEPDVSLRQSCVRFFSKHGTREDIAFLRTLMDRGDSAAASVRQEIEAAIRGIEDKG
jgi:HEAT repeat protein